MKSVTRRQFGLATGGILGLTAAAKMAAAQTKARVVVIGGGIGGATVAKYLAANATTLDITLVEPKTQYTTCFFSNLYLAGLRSLDSLTHSYEALADRYGINIIHELATSIDPVSKRVLLSGGRQLPYDRLVVSPGINFKFGAIGGYDQQSSQIIPHAWNAGPQTVLLRQQIQNMEQGGVFIITAPENPFRCPPGPYERASLIAYYFKQYNPRAKILILDNKDTFFEQDLFEDAWQRHYPGMIEWLPAQFTGGLESVDVQNLTLKTANETFAAAAANIIPPQVAGALALQAGLGDNTGWCPVDPSTFESALQPGIHVIGDAANAGDMPKSAYVANSQAKACAFAIIAALTGRDAPAPHLYNTCYTYLSADDAVSDAISFNTDAGIIKISEIMMSNVGETKEARRQAVREAGGWYDAFTHDVFG